MTFNPEKITADQIYQKLGGGKTVFTDLNPNLASVNSMYDRIEAVSRNRGMITYSDLVRGLKFVDEKHGRHQPFEIFAFDWKGIDRAFIGSVLAQMLVDSLPYAQCVITSVIVDKGHNAPSKVLFDWLYEMGVLPDLNEVTVLSFWAHHVRKTHDFFKHTSMLLQVALTVNK